jgi:hypothetical protein
MRTGNIQVYKDLPEENVLMALRHTGIEEKVF